MIQVRKYKSFVATALLLLFVVAAVPKYFYHDTLSNHNHKLNKNTEADTKHKIDKSNSCACEDLYTDIVFDTPAHFFSVPSYSVTYLFNEAITASPTSLPKLCTTRGPPYC